MGVWKEREEAEQQQEGPGNGGRVCRDDEFRLDADF
jgi:hypothetical protein